MEDRIYDSIELTEQNRRDLQIIEDNGWSKGVMAAYLIGFVLSCVAPVSTLLLLPLAFLHRLETSPEVKGARLRLDRQLKS